MQCCKRFDTLWITVIVSASFKIVLFIRKHPGAPLDGENREAGENPARSRHCDERSKLNSSSQETCPDALQLLNARGKAFRPPGLPFRFGPADCLFSLSQTGAAGLCVYVTKQIQNQQAGVWHCCARWPWWPAVQLKESRSNLIPRQCAP